jgi:hypothetical protein
MKSQGLSYFLSKTYRARAIGAGAFVSSFRFITSHNVYYVKLLLYA